ncbi:MAG TPA: DUF4429 domain-containing protein [Mycobacteriales bacterium]|nr:DUF4429 domain-containing protein [Mycobacteriales bacterium]
MITAQGYNGRMSLSGDWVHVERTGWGHVGQQVGRRIPVGDIAEIELRPAGLLRNGHLRIALAGGSTAPPSATQLDGDEGTVIFTREQQPEFETLRDAIMDARHG